MDIVDQTSVSLMTLTCVTRGEGQHDLHFTIQRFCIIS